MSTTYSKKFKGNAGNYKWPVKFDNTDGYIGINQTKDDGSTDSVLLSPKQVKELIAFVKRK